MINKLSLFLYIIIPLPKIMLVAVHSSLTQSYGANQLSSSDPTGGKDFQMPGLGRPSMFSLLPQVFSGLIEEHIRTIAKYSSCADLKKIPGVVSMECKNRRDVQSLQHIESP